MKTIQEKIEVMQAYIDGKKIECKSIDHPPVGWVRALEPQWNWYDYDYRVSPLSKPSINWEHVSPEFNYLVMGTRGMSGMLSSGVPLKDLGLKCWLFVGSNVSAIQFSSYIPGDCNWEHSLVCRPGFGTSE